MIGKPKTIVIKEIYDMMKQGKLIIPPYQRNFVWNTKQQALLIDSILKGHYIGQMLLAKSEKSDYYNIIDGQQRIKTIYFFIENGFKVNKDDEALGEIAKQDFLNRPLQFYIIDEFTDEKQIVEIFELINTTGEPLTNQELRRVKATGKFSKIVSELSIEIFPDKENLMVGKNTEELFATSFWNRLGILTKQQILKMEDEALIARIIISVLFNKWLTFDDDLLDKAYDINSFYGSEINDKLTNEFLEEIRTIFMLLLTTTFNVEHFSKEGFYIIFLALYNIVITEQKSIKTSDLLVNVFININSLVPNNQAYNFQYEPLCKYAKHLILQHCFDNEDLQKIGLLKNILNNSKVETAKYEFKQGFLRLSDDRKKDKALNNQIIETICGMANARFMEPAYLLIGIADKESDANRINLLDQITPVKLGEHYIVGIEREAKIQGISIDKYCAQIKEIIDNSALSQALKLSVLANVDVVTYQGFSVIVIIIPPQKELSFIGDKVFVRKCSSTTEVTNSREVIALANKFSRF